MLELKSLRIFAVRYRTCSFTSHNHSGALRAQHGSVTQQERTLARIPLLWWRSGWAIRYLCHEGSVQAKAEGLPQNPTHTFLFACLYGAAGTRQLRISCPQLLRRGELGSLLRTLWRDDGEALVYALITPVISNCGSQKRPCILSLHVPADWSTREACDPGPLRVAVSRATSAPSLRLIRVLATISTDW